MSKLILRLDDACPTMNAPQWDKMEKLLDKYQIKPIVGIIPDNKDEAFNFPFDKSFWDKCFRWQEKGWTIAQHGVHHKLKYRKAKGYFQLAVERTTELAGESYENQRDMLLKGKNILESHGIRPVCFFAPCHTFDKITVDAVKDIGYRFISDGYAFRAYKKRNVVFLPTIFDSPHVIGGVQTFVFPPNSMNKVDFFKLEKFIACHQGEFLNTLDYIDSVTEHCKGQGIIGKTVEISVYILRKVRGFHQ